MRQILAVFALLLPLLTWAAEPVAPPALAARAYFLLDYQSGQVLAASNAEAKIEPASLTKLMTAYLTFKAVKEGRLKLTQTLTVSQRGYKVGGSTMFLEPNTPVTVDNLIKGMIVVSGNDACVTLAEAIAGSEDAFAQQMTHQALTMGLLNTRFHNSTGITEEMHYTTAADLGRLAAAIIRDYPEFYPIYSMKEFSFNNGKKNITQPNRNLLLFRDPNVDGLKTGHTEAAGFNLIASTHRDGRRLVAVVTGTNSEEARARETAKLLAWGISQFDTQRVYAAGQVLATPLVWKGKADQARVGFLNPVYVSVPKGQVKNLRQEIHVQEPLLAPKAKGQEVGKLRLKLNGQLVGEYPLVALDAIEPAGWFGRAWDSMKLWFH